jgi:hypothetical protein
MDIQMEVLRVNPAGGRCMRAQDVEKRRRLRALQAHTAQSAGMLKSPRNSACAQDVEKAATAFAKEKVKYGCPADADSIVDGHGGVNGVKDGDEGIPSSPTSPRSGKPPAERCLPSPAATSCMHTRPGTS